MLAAGDGVDELAILIENLDFQVAKDMPALLVISNLRIRWAVASVESGISFGPTATHVKVLNHRPPGNQGCFFGH